MSRTKDETELQRYFDGELRPRRARKVRRRLESDARARGQLAAMESMHDLLCESVDAAAGEARLDGLWARVRTGVQNEPRLGLRERLSFWFRRWGIVVAASAAAAVVLLAVLLVHPQHAPARNDAVIESLDVGPEAVGTIFTIGDSGDSGETTVIWVTETSAEGGN